MAAVGAGRGKIAEALIEQATQLYADEPLGAELEQAAHALDSTTIDLCLSLFSWAKFRRRNAAIKLPTVLALRGNFPTVVILTTGQAHDVDILEELTYDPGSFYKRFPPWSDEYLCRASAGGKKQTEVASGYQNAFHLLQEAAPLRIDPPRDCWP